MTPEESRFQRDLEIYKRLCVSDEFPLQLRPMLKEFNWQGASVDPYYFPQDLWASRKIHAHQPAWHLDVGSRIDGFVAHLLTFMDVTYADQRAFQIPVSGLHSIPEDARTLDSIATASVPSLSSLNAPEHFGLGRYGDEIDPEGWRKACRSFCRVLAPGGRLYFAVPVGKQRVDFNAYRIFRPATIIQAFVGLSLASFAAVNDQREFIDPADPADYTQASFSFGFFEFRKGSCE